MLYEKITPNTKYIIRNELRELVRGKGQNIIQKGIYAEFRGSPLRWDSTQTAEETVNWEVQMGRTKPAGREKRIKELDEEIRIFMEEHEDFKQNKVFEALTKQESEDILLEEAERIKTERKEKRNGKKST